VTISADVAESFSRHRPLLFGIAYRMLGTAADAEDVVQDAFVRWLQSSTSEIESPKAYLSKVVIRLCIDYLRSARVRREVYTGEWLPEPIATTTADVPMETAMERESLSFAFLVMLQSLAPLERAVLLLREVFDYDYPEIAAAIDRSEANCRQILHRAHQRIADRQPRFAVPYDIRARLAEQFRQAIVDGDIATLLQLLTEDATFISDSGGKAPAFVRAGLRPVQGADKVARGMLGGLKTLPQTLDIDIEELNGQPAIVGYLNGQTVGAGLLDIDGDRISAIYLIVNPDKLSHLRRAARER
jgi:RNA polymerase sigma-70 factor (ECF subfamily)